MKRNRLEKLGDFVLGKGFYIVLFLCVAAIGISGYYLIRSVNGGGEPNEPVTANPAVTLPDSSAQTPLPSQLEEEAPEEPQEEALQEDDPEPVKVPAEEETAAPEEPKEVVYTWPVKGTVLSAFSLEQQVFSPTMGDWRTHEGVDIAADLGIQVKAAAGGTVTAIEQDYFMGTTVTIDHGNGMVSVYSNLAEQPTVEVGDVVTTGDIIGSVGSTAKAESLTASHLHLEMMKDGVYVDPLEYLPDVK